MSVRVMADVWDFGPEDPIDNSVLLWLANRCNDQGGSCFPSIAEIAKKARRSERTVMRSIEQLEVDGWLTVERGSGRGIVSQYTVNVAKLKEGQPVSVSNKRVTATTEKGDSDDNPPHPLLGRTVNEPSITPEIIYGAYPYKKSPEKAKRAIEKALKRIDAATLLERVTAYANLPEVIAMRKGPKDKNYIPYPATWFNAGSYDDEDLQPKAPSSQDKARAEYDAKVEAHMAEMEKFQ